MVIGISARNVYINQKKKKFVNETYLIFCKKYNLVPLLIFKDNFHYLKDLCDGYLLVGGDDLDPKLYNEKNTSSINIDQEIDELDYLIIKNAIETKKPFLGICRGLQAMNTYLKGSLFQNIDEIHYHNNKTFLNIKNSRFFAFLNNKTIMINSYHHQGIKTIGKDLLYTGVSDGIIELIEHKSLPLIGMQFHPELLNTEEIEEMMRVFIDLMEEYHEGSRNKKNY